MLPAGPQLTGSIRQVRAASATDRSQFELVFTQISLGAYRTSLSAILIGLDNARETVNDKGLINGIDGAETYSSRLNQGIEKLQNNDRFAGLAGLIQGAKQAPSKFRTPTPISITILVSK